MGSSAPPTKRTRISIEEQTEKIELAFREAEQRMLSRHIDCLDIITGEVKQMDARVLTLEREDADLRSMRVRMGERVEMLNREVENLQAAGERLAALEARLATQCKETSSCDLRVHGVPYVEGEDLRSLSQAMLQSPPKVSDIVRARKSQQTHVDPVIIIKMLSPREKSKQLGQVRMYRREQKEQLSLPFLDFNSEAIIYVIEQLLKEH